jgi:hypothetical protein
MLIMFCQDFNTVSDGGAIDHLEECHADLIVCKCLLMSLLLEFIPS